MQHSQSWHFPHAMMLDSTVFQYSVKYGILLWEYSDSTFTIVVVIFVLSENYRVCYINFVIVTDFVHCRNIYYGNVSRFTFMFMVRNCDWSNKKSILSHITGLILHIACMQSGLLCLPQTSHYMYWHSVRSGINAENVWSRNSLLYETLVSGQVGTIEHWISEVSTILSSYVTGQRSRVKSPGYIFVSHDPCLSILYISHISFTLTTCILILVNDIISEGLLTNLCVF